MEQTIYTVDMESIDYKDAIHRLKNSVKFSYISRSGLRSDVI